MKERLYESYDTIQKKRLTWTEKLSDHLRLAHVARKKRKTSKRQCPLSQYRFKIRERSPEGITMTTEERICEIDSLQ